MRPPRCEIEQCPDIESVAVTFGVSERTARRWLSYYGLLITQPNFKPNKLKKKAHEIKNRHWAGEDAKSLAREYGVTIAAIRRVICGVTYREKDFAIVRVIYNPS